MTGVKPTRPLKVLHGKGMVGLYKQRCQPLYRYVAAQADSSTVMPNSVCMIGKGDEMRTLVPS